MGKNLLSQGLFFNGSCNDDMTAHTTAIYVRDLRGFSNDFFNTKYYMVVMKNYNNGGVAPEGQCRQITDYVSDTGLFTTVAFGANVEANDIVLVLHESIALMGLHADATLAKMVDDSWIAHILAIDGDVSDYDDNTDSLEAIRDHATTIKTDTTAIIEDVSAAVPLTPTANSLQDIISKLDGANTYDNTLHSLEAIGDLVTATAQATNVTTALEADDLDHISNANLPGALDGSVTDTSILGILASAADVTNFDRTTDSLEALGTALIAVDAELALIPQSGGTASWNATALAAIQSECEDAIDSTALVAAPTADSLASFVASGGTALGTNLPASKSLYDEVRQYGDGYLVSKEITYNGAASYAAFTVTGMVTVKVVGYITTILTNHGDATSVGTATSAAGLIVATAGTAMQTANAVWVDNTPAKFDAFPSAYSLIGDGEDIAVVGTANLVGGVVTFYCFWKPLTSDGNVVPV